jgi:hypothetical protein
MHLGGDGTIYVSWFDRAADIYFTRSTDGGTTFVPEVRVSKGISTNSYTSLLQRTPQFAVDTRGNIHLIWMEDRINGQTDIWYSRSTDQGGTWSAPASIMDANDSAKYPQDFPAIAIDSADNIYVAFLDFRGGLNRSEQYTHLFMIKSLDGGATWSNPVNALRYPDPITNAGTCQCCKIDIEASREGHLYIAFRSDINNRRDIWAVRSMDGGASWDPAILVQSGVWTLPDCPTTGPNIVLDRNENLHLTWRDARDNSKKSIAYYSMLRFGDSTVFPNKALTNGADPSTNWPDIALSGTGVIYTAYQAAAAGGKSSILYNYSTDGGNTWQAGGSISGPATADQSLVTIETAVEGRLYAVWQDARNDAADIFFSKSSGPIGVQYPRSVTLLAPSGTVAGGEQTFRWTRPSGLGQGEFVWYDLTVTGLQNQSLNAIRDTFVTLSFSPGMYDYKVVAHTIVGTSKSSSSFTVSTAGVEQPAVAPLSFILSPNPVQRSGKVYAHVTLAVPDRVEVMVFDLLGNRRWGLSSILSAGESSIPLDFSSLPAGPYGVEIRTSHAVNRQMILVE